MNITHIHQSPNQNFTGPLTLPPHLDVPLATVLLPAVNGLVGLNGNVGSYVQLHSSTANRIQPRGALLVADHGGSNDDRLALSPTIPTARRASLTAILVLDVLDSGHERMDVFMGSLAAGLDCRIANTGCTLGYDSGNGAAVRYQYPGLSRATRNNKRMVIVISINRPNQLMATALNFNGQLMTTSGLIGSLSAIGSSSSIIPLDAPVRTGAAAFGNYYHTAGYVVMSAVFPGVAISQAECDDIAINPFQILAYNPKRVYSEVPVPPTPIASDQFSGVANTALQTYNPLWVPKFTPDHNSYTRISSAGTIYSHFNQTTWQYDTAPPGPDHSVSADIIVMPSLYNYAQAGVTARVNPSSNTYYEFDLYILNADTRHQWSLRRVVNGSATELASRSDRVTPGQVHRMELRCVGTKITALLNGSVFLQAEDSNIPGEGGLAGFTQRAHLGKGTTSAFQLDNWQVIDLETSTSGSIKIWNGSSWVTGTPMRWNGSSWVSAAVKFWNGSSWITRT